MCTPNEFDPIILQLELKKRKEIVQAEEAMRNKLHDKVENFKKKMQQKAVTKQSIANDLVKQTERGNLLIGKPGNKRISFLNHNHREFTKKMYPPLDEVKINKRLTNIHQSMVTPGIKKGMAVGLELVHELSVSDCEDHVDGHSD